LNREDIKFGVGIVVLLIAIVALIVAIHALVTTKLFFFTNFCIEQKQDRDEYFNQLEIIKLELASNFRTVSNIVGNKDEILEGNDIPVFTYNVGILNQILSQGLIRNSELREKLYSIAQIENYLNRLLDTSLATRAASVGADPESKAEHMVATTGITKEIVKVSEQLDDEIERVLEAIKIGKYDIESQSCRDSFDSFFD